MSRLLITGAAGFIGFYLARHLKARGDIVIGLDNFNPYYDPALKNARAQILDEEGIPVIHGDICSTELLRFLLKEHAITGVVHLAAQAGVRYSTLFPQTYVKANLEGFVSVLEACRSYPDITLTYASSSSVYGKGGDVPSSLEACADKPLSLYGATKRSNELMAHAYYHLYGLRSTALRYFTVYGPWGRPDMAYYLFAKAMLAGNPIHLSAGGAVQRSFTYIDDIVIGTAAAIDKVKGYEIFNLGYPHQRSLSELVALLEIHLGVQAHAVMQPLPSGDVVATYADISTSDALLGFHPKVDLDEGIGYFASWYRSFYKDQ